MPGGSTEKFIAIRQAFEEIEKFMEMRQIKVKEALSESKTQTEIEQEELKAKNPEEYEKLMEE